LRFVPRGKTVVLGLITTKAGKLESPDELQRRIEEAARYLPLEDLALSSPVRLCLRGFGQSDHDGRAMAQAGVGGRVGPQGVGLVFYSPNAICRLVLGMRSKARC
jgi:hypothetical protein